MPIIDECHQVGRTKDDLSHIGRNKVWFIDNIEEVEPGVNQKLQ